MALSLSPSSLLSPTRFFWHMLLVLFTGSLAATFLYSHWRLLFDGELADAIVFAIVVLLAVLFGMFVTECNHIFKWYLPTISGAFLVVALVLRFTSALANDAVLRWLVTAVCAIALFAFTALESDLLFRSPTGSSGASGCFRSLLAEIPLVISPLIPAFLLWFPFSQTWAYDGQLLLMGGITLGIWLMYIFCPATAKTEPSAQISFKEQCKILFNLPNLLRTVIWVGLYVLTMIILIPDLTYGALNAVLEIRDMQAVPFDYLRIYLGLGFLAGLVAAIAVTYLLDRLAPRWYISLLVIFGLFGLCALRVVDAILYEFYFDEIPLTLFSTILCAVGGLLLLAIPIGRYLCVKIGKMAH